MNWTLAIPELVLSCCGLGDHGVRGAAQKRESFMVLCSMFVIGAVPHRRRCWC